MEKIKIGLIILGLMTLVGLVVGLTSQIEMNLESKGESENSEISGLSGFGLPNPSAVYCKELGYEYEIKDGNGGQVGICTFSDGSSAKAWEFYSGDCKGEFSYCTIKGYGLKTKENCAWSSKCSVCILPNEEEIPAFILMLKEKPKKDYLKEFYKDIEKGQTPENPSESDSSSEDLPQGSSVGSLTSFDWRNNNGDWLTPVKDQGQCGSCWAFASVGAHESQINIKSNSPTIDKDLAEQYLVSDCFLPADCNGLYLSDIDKLFNFHKDNGIIDEGCFPYIAKNSPCSPICKEPLWKIENWYPVAADTTDIKTVLINEGPLWVGLYMSSNFDVDNIMRCNRFQDRSVNHAVVIVGYNDDGQYWIVRNSWGANWGSERNGYFKVGYGECNIDSYISGYKDIVALKGKPVGPVCSTDTDCNDSLYCNGAESCVSGVCQAGIPVDCSASSNQCNNGVCDEATDSCVVQPKANGTTCDDGLYCNTGEMCQVGVCTGGLARVCDDAKTCTVDNCSEEKDTCEFVWPICGGTPDSCCGPQCSSTNDLDCPATVKCWSGTNLYLYRNNDQASKFCKCASGIYGYNSYKYNRATKTVYKYLYTADDTTWDVTSLSSSGPVYSVTCTDGKAYSTNVDYTYPK